LIALVIFLSHLFHWLRTTVTYEVINPQTHKVEKATAAVNSLLSADGIRFMLNSMVRNFTKFGPVEIILVVMIGVGLAEQAGLINALIKKIVIVTPRKAVTWILVTLGVLTKTFSSLSGLVFLLFVISQFLAYFNHSNMATVLAVNMGDALEHANLGTIPLMLGFITVTGVVGMLIVGAIPKWALLAPIFVPLFMRLGVAPEAVMAAYRVADSPPNIVTPLMPYFALIVVVSVVWILLFLAWELLGIPYGPG
jgi:p-aminobenzoyl-glutamate transporter AbgT